MAGALAPRDASLSRGPVGSLPRPGAPFPQPPLWSRPPRLTVGRGGAGCPSAPPSGRLRGRPGPDREPDFLTLQCDVCKQDFHKDHFTCAAHKCPFAFEKIFICWRSKEGCRKEMLQVICDQGRGSFRIQRRHPLDHSCPRGNLAVSVAG
uniref:AN1-type domain-containing protein n=1 Tax=Lynx canadensis TaxID=61383 RepID=A0A667J514_LYNCA